jgi:heme-degrading monooxygenase HmoA
MFTVIHTITSPLASADHLERTFAAAANLEGVPGFLGSRLLKNTPESELLEYQAIFEWESRAAFETWRRGESFRPGGQVNTLPDGPTVRTETYETPS